MEPVRSCCSFEESGRPESGPPRFLSDGPRFVIVQDHKENPRKCTALPLGGLPAIEIVRLPRPRPTEELLEVPGGLFLDVDAPVLSARDSSLVGRRGSVLVLDASWNRLESLRRRIRVRAGETLHARSLPRAFRTAYPRRSKLRPDPGAGLATVEAVFATTAVLGLPRPELLVAYRWGDEFLARNEEAFRSFPADAARRERDHG